MNFIVKNKWVLVGGLVVLLIYALSREFLFTKDCDECITGWQALKQEGRAFWGWAIVLSALAGGITYLIVRYIKKEGGYGVKLGILIPPLVFLSIAWGKGCTDKQNDAVTTEKGRPVPAKIDSTRMSAEDIIKQQQK